MDAIETIKAKLAKYRNVRYTERAGEITIHASDESGFDVSLAITPTGFTVSYDGWHEEFTVEEEALNCFAFGLSTECRLAIVFRGNMPMKWVMEGLQDGVWTADSETGLVFQPFWRPRRVEYRQNRLIGS